MSPHRLTAEDLESYMTRLVRGLHLAGEGSFAQVFHHPTDPNLVVKVVVDDPVYMEYVSFCKRQGSNRWLPHIVEYHQLTVEDHDDVWAVFMPRLAPASPGAIDLAFERLAPWIPDITVFSERKRLSFPEWRNLVRMTDDPETRIMATWMWRHFNRLDLLRQNFMMRDKQLVFNDPVASKE